MFKRLFPRSCKRLRIFVSYARPDKELASEIAQGFRNRGDRVFFDKESLLPASDFNQQIEESIESSDRFIFVASRASLSEGRYTITELNAAKRKWPSPVGRVWTIIAEPDVQESELNAYLRSVHVLRPSGNLYADLLSAIETSRPVGLLCRAISVALILLIFASVIFGVTHVLRKTNPREVEARFGPTVAVGHWTGVPLVIANLTLRNTTAKQKIVRFERAYFESPTGENYEIISAVPIVNGIDQMPLPFLTLEPETGAFAADYEFRAAFGETFNVAERINRHYNTPEYAKVMTPQPDLIKGELLEELKTAAEREFVWSAGDWMMVIDYTASDSVGAFNQAFSVSVGFTLSESQVKEMKSYIADYDSGAGVFPAWHRLRRNMTPALIRLSSRPRESLALETE